ncbi:MAG: cupin domain-containing protein [Ardenticatenaceae bacterium]
MISKRNVNDEDVPWRSGAYHVAARYRELAVGAGGRIQYVEVEVGGRILPHAPKQEQVWFCLDGEGSFIVDNEETTCRSGDCLAAPRNSVRGVVNQGTAPLRLLIVQARGNGWNPLSLLSLVRRRVKRNP